MGTKTRAALAVLGIGLGAAVAARTSAEVSVVGTQGPSSSQTAYIVPVAAGVRVVSILTAGDSVNSKLDLATPYRYVGIPDGQGAIDAGEGAMLITGNHEINTASASVRAHGSNGAFVSAMEVDRTTLQVRSAYDLIRTVMLWNAATQTYTAGTTSFDRFCSADVPAVTAFWDAASGMGTTERFHMNGEESGTGRAMAHQITGVNAGVSWELPRMGKQGWENIIACPHPQVKTVVACTDDTTPGQVYIYVGTKLPLGVDVQKAGLTNGTLYGVIANGARTEDRPNGIGLAKGVAGSFTLVALPNQAANGANTENAADGLLVTEFLRPEDGHWDPSHPEDFYFVTTDGALPSGRARLWRLHFTDIKNPENGGQVTMLLDGTEGGDMYDNICIDRLGHVILCEDLGGNAKSGKIWQYDIPTGALTILAKHDVARFGDTGSSPTSPFNNDEEGTGVFDASDFLGPGWFVVATQAHYSISGELFQGGQLMALYNPASVAAPSVTAAASCVPAIPLVGESVQFDVGVSVVGDGVLTYAWTFGDGTGAVGRNPSHAYSTAGVYTATVTATHTASGKSAVSSVLVDVGRPLGNFDVVVQLSFSTPNKDSLDVTGELPIPAGYDPAGKQVTFDVGGVSRTFTMDASGNASLNANETFTLKLKKSSGGEIAAQHGWFEMLLVNQDLKAPFVDEGFTNRTTSNEASAIAIVVTFGGHSDRAVRDVLYTSTVNKKGLAR